MNPLESVQAELAAATLERAKLDNKIEILKRTVTLLEPIYGSKVVSLGEMMNQLADLGMTAAVEKVLTDSPGIEFAPTEVRDKLIEGGFKIVGDNPMASVHQVLRRLAAKPENHIRSRERPGQSMAYVYVRPGLSDLIAGLGSGMDPKIKNLFAGPVSAPTDFGKKK